MAFWGEIFLFSALVISLLCAANFFTDKINKRLIAPAYCATFILVALAFLLLVYSFATSNFNLKIVFENSHSLKPLFYKITSAWGNHEGSMLLFITLLSMFGLWFVKQQLGDKSFSRALAMQSLIIAALLGFLLFTSNPFVTITLIPVMPADGLGFNPILQDVALAFHPPLLYLGYIGFATNFALVLGSKKNFDVKNSRKIVLVAWSFLSLGILAGSWWAYRELGWGGFWFWDPVENSSLMPWLCGTALLHCYFLPQNKANQKWIAGLSIATFLLSLVGFFLVRSGVLTSVHSFATDSERGLIMLAIFIFFLVISVSKYAAINYAPQRKGKNTIRQFFIGINNIILVFLAGIVLLATLYPLLIEYLNGQKLSVGTKYFSQIFSAVAIMLLPMAAIGVFAKNKYYTKTNYIAAVLAAIPAFYFYKNGLEILPALVIYSAGILFFTLLINFVKERSGVIKYLSHLGLLVFIVGAVFATSFSQEFIGKIEKNKSIQFAGFDIKLTKIVESSKDNYVYRQAVINVFKNDYELGNAYPEQRLYPVENKKTAETDLLTHNLSDIYFALGDKLENEEAYAIRIYYKSMINLIWLGGLLMFFAGFARFIILLFRK